MAAFSVVVLSAMVVFCGGVPAMALAMAVVCALVGRMGLSIVVISVTTALVSTVVDSVVLAVPDAPDCCGIVVVEMVVPLGGSRPFFSFFGCFAFAIVDAVEAQLWWLLLLWFVLFLWLLMIQWCVLKNICLE